MPARRGTLRVATWNINSLRLRLPLLHKLIAALDPDVICLQETKVPDELFPPGARPNSATPTSRGAGMKGYNGVAIFSRRPIGCWSDAPDWCAKGDCRHVAVAVEAKGGPVEVHDFYVPAGGDIPDRAANPKYGHKLDFIAEARAWFAARAAEPGTGLARTVVVGDLNIAPLEHDVWSHKQLLDVVSHTPAETEGCSPGRTPASSTRFATSCRPRKSCSPGGRIATATGEWPTAAGGWTMSG
jgi:exodeoxyribonuclease-3